MRGVLAVCAPLAPHLAEDAWLNLPYQKPAASVFQAGWASVKKEWMTLPQVRRMERAVDLWRMSIYRDWQLSLGSEAAVI